MSEHTPTTEDVREWYAETIDMYESAHRDPKRVAQFDRWLAQVKAEVWDQGHSAGYPYVPKPVANPYSPEPSVSKQTFPILNETSK